MRSEIKTTYEIKDNKGESKTEKKTISEEDADTNNYSATGDNVEAEFWLHTNSWRIFVEQI